ncbi:PD-(D/E)XK nuclease family protein [Glycomyces sp. NPDC047369]
MKTTAPTPTSTVERLSLADLATDSCPAYRRAKPASDRKLRADRHRAFLLGEVRDGIRRAIVEGEDETGLRTHLARSRQPLSPAEIAWVVAGVGKFELPGPDLRLLDGDMVYQHTSPSGAVKELDPWAIFSVSLNFDEVSVDLPRYREGAKPFGAEKIATAAYCAAFGTPADPLRPWERQRPHRLRSAPASPRKVTVYEYAVDTGKRTRRFRGSDEEARQRYFIDGIPAATQAADPAIRRPGRDCERCAFAAECEALPKAPGLFGITTPGAPRGGWSATNGSKHSKCRLQDHLFRQNVTRHEPSAPERIGRALDAVLNERHRSGRDCGSRRPLATLAEWQRFGDLRTEEEAAIASAALARHGADTCPFSTGLYTSDALPQQAVTVYDPDSEVILHATPDLLYTEDDGLVWRETKYTQSIPNWTFDALTSRHSIQMATAVLLMASGAVGGGTPKWVEIEFLSPGGSDWVRIDIADEHEVERARAVVAASASPWRERPEDITATPGRHCGFCDARGICGSAATEETP